MDNDLDAFTSFSATEQCALIELVNYRGRIDEALVKHGAVLFTGFEASREQLRQFVTALSGPPLPYIERSSPRSIVADGIYTSTNYPPSGTIFLHNEQSYNLSFPRRLYFYCEIPADNGGETLLADARRIYERVPAAMRSRLEQEGYLLVRNYRQNLGLSWREVFQTSSRTEAEAYCQSNQIDFEWIGDDLRTTQLREVTAVHPITQQLCWFNHMTFFNVGSLPTDIGDMLTEEFGPWGVPTNTFYGAGDEISGADLATLRSAYSEGKGEVRWRCGDVLIVDNILAAHGRAPFSGDRRLLTSLSGQTSWSNVRPRPPIGPDRPTL